MSRWLDRIGGRKPSAASLHVGAQALVWRPASGEAVRSVPLDAAALDAPDWRAAFAALALDEGASVQVTLADRWCRWWVLEPPAGLSRLADLRAFAQARLVSVYGLDPTAWVVECETPDVRRAWSRTTGPLACCAMPLALLSALREAAEARRVGLQRVAPQGAELCAAWLAKKDEPVAATRWLASLQADHALLAVAQNGRVQALRQCWLGGAAALGVQHGAALADEIAGMALGLGLAAPTQVTLHESRHEALHEARDERDATRDKLRIWRLPAPTGT